MGLVLEFNELEVGAQVGIQTTDRGVISGVAVSNGSGGTSGFRLVVVDNDANQTFNGDGSGGATQIYPMTIIQCQNIDAARTWKLTNTAIEDGWLVAMNIEGADPGEVSVTDNDDVNLQIINVSNPTGQTNNVPYPVFYYDADLEGWQTLRSRILVP